MADDGREVLAVNDPLRWDTLDPEVDAFVDANMVSFASWDLIVYLNRNPGACESVAQFANVLARQQADMVPVVRLLVKNGVVEEQPDGDEVRFRLSDSPEVRRVVSTFIRMASRRENRLEFVRRVLAQMTGA